MQRAALTVVLTVAGLAALAWQVDQIGYDEITRGFRAIGWGFVPILILSGARLALRSRAWTALSGDRIPFRSALAATIAGDALGNVTPLSLLASEPAKAMYVGRHFDPARALAALAAENFFYSVSVALYVIASAVAMLVAYALPPEWRQLGFMALGGMSAVLVGGAWLAWRQPTFASAITARLPNARLRALAGRVRSFETDTYSVVSGQPGRMRTLVLCETVFHIVSFAECWLTFYLLTGTTSLLPAFVFDGLNRVINVIFKVMPLRLAVDEGSARLLAIAIGFSGADGFMLGIVRKVRVIAWMLVGLGIYVRRTIRQ